MSTTFVASLGVNLDAEQCCNCGIVFAVPSDFKQKRIADQQWFYCPRGHSQHYAGKSDLQKTQELLDAALRESENLRAARNAAQEQAAHESIERKKVKTRLRSLQTRVKNGVCPCCNRQFVNLSTHMHQEHPTYTAES